ncbi:hypothetical protein G9H64_05305 [Aquirufa nivalisilvae]|uniref:hypothetical protein n=1 Tax=Aquirufa nivalisilvae TaxID=2516557 RepID=UPI000D69CD72|nr:hypothetical protein [Aquirufa nivalisilvae]MCZ2480240.1 hypothetical protein [Aquirufa nivalisilvae]MCZ2482365.1 hypothetical protein [Aquirufa nivalisilvae]TBH73753.1 hypothetical protein EWU22_08790 [Aquirufa nivalisilvae]
MTIKQITLVKNAIGILIFWIAPPLIYFFKEKLGFGGGSVFTGIVYVSGLLFMLNHFHAKVGHKPNTFLLLLGGTFFSVAMIYFFLMNKEMTMFNTDLINFALIFGFFFSLLRVDNQVQKYLPVLILIITFLTSCALIYSVATNPNYVFGTRATVQYTSKTTENFTGNPYIYSRNGLAGFLISFLIINRSWDSIKVPHVYLTRLLAHINVWFSLIVIILTQTRATILTVLMALPCMLFFMVPVKSIFSNIKRQSYIFYALVIGNLYYFATKLRIVELIDSYYNSFFNLFIRAMSTGVTLGKSSEVDESAMGRVNNINYIKQLWSTSRIDFIFGHGYRYRYIDIPMLESLVNFGVFGFILFASFHVAFLYFAYRCFKSQIIFQNFIGLFYLNTFVGMFTSGRPMDFAYWVSFLIFIRFMNVEMVKDKNEIESQL